MKIAIILCEQYSMYVYVHVVVKAEGYCSRCRINLILGLYVHVVVKGGGYSSRCSRQLEWKQAPLTTCDDIDDVIKARATGTFPFSR